MFRLAYLIVAAALLAGACIQIVPAVKVKTLAPPVSYLGDVEPILGQRCVVCHSCYNAACQLKLSSFEGLDRGGSKASVYSSSRLRAQDPSRLFIDALAVGATRRAEDRNSQKVSDVRHARRHQVQFG